MGKDAWLDLAVVGTEEFMAFWDDEGFADPETVVPFHGNVLEIRIGGGEPSGGGDGLVQ